MTTYAFCCRSCGETLEVERLLSESPPPALPCPSCPDALTRDYQAEAAGPADAALYRERAQTEGGREYIRDQYRPGGPTWSRRRRRT